MRVSYQLDRKALNRLSVALETQVPYATAVALTRTAAQARDEIREGLAKSFTLRNKYTQGGIRYQRAEKKDWPRQSAIVGSISGYMEIQEEGGPKVSKGKARTIPKGIRSSENRTVSRSKWPGKILPEDAQLKGGGRTKGAKNGARGKRLPFLIEEHHGVGVYVRRGRKRFLKRLYRLTREPLRVRPTHWLTEPVERVVKRDLGRNFERALEDALKPKG